MFTKFWSKHLKETGQSADIGFEDNIKMELKHGPKMTGIN
jgi:hypothetical protein